MSYSKVCGLVNIGNTCYFNSVLQSLFHTKIFNDSLFNELNIPTGTLINVYLKTYTEYHNNSIISPNKLINKFGRITNGIFNKFNQNDTQEFLILFLDIIHNEIKEQINIILDENTDPIFYKSQNTWKEFMENNYSIITRRFYGQFETGYMCSICDNTDIAYQPFVTLCLYIDKNDCLENLIANYFKDESLTRLCEKCNCNTTTTKRINIFRLSNIFIIYLDHRCKYEIISEKSLLKYNNNQNTSNIMK